LEKSPVYGFPGIITPAFNQIPGNTASHFLACVSTKPCDLITRANEVKLTYPKFTQPGSSRASSNHINGNVSLTTH